MAVVLPAATRSRSSVQVNSDIDARRGGEARTRQQREQQKRVPHPPFAGNPRPCHLTQVRDGGRDNAIERGKVDRMVGLVIDRDRQAVVAQNEDALVRGAGGPGGIRRQVREQPVDVGAEAGGIAGAGMRRGQRVIGPSRRQQALAVPYPVRRYSTPSLA